MNTPGRSCPLSYRHGPEALRAADTLAADPLWVVGGLYGNPEALQALQARLAADARAGCSPRLVFNGDFHWFDTERDDFRAVQAGVMAHHALAGNVEAELAAPDAGAGCGCAYPEFVDDATVERSNAIMQRLQATAAANADIRAALAALPQVLRARVGDCAIGIVHGDPDSLAGWGLAVENLAARGGPTDGARVRDWARRADVDAFACSHTCLPWAATPGGVPVINNGSGGMPNFRGRLHGLATRIGHAAAPAPDAVFGIEARGLRFEAVPVRYDAGAWQARFERDWPPGSPAHRSYHARIMQGPAFEPGDALPGC